MWRVYRAIEGIFNIKSQRYCCNTDLLACLWNDLYIVISLQKEKGPRAPFVTSLISDYTLVLKEDFGISLQTAHNSSFHPVFVAKYSKII